MVGANSDNFMHWCTKTGQRDSNSSTSVIMMSKVRQQTYLLVNSFEGSHEAECEDLQLPAGHHFQLNSDFHFTPSDARSV